MKYQFVIFSALSLCLGSISSQNALSDEILLKNGDRITGKIGNKDDGTVTLKTDYAGTLKIKWQKIEKIVSDAPLEIVTDKNTFSKASLFVSDKEYTPSAEAVALSDVKYINPPTYMTGSGVSWKGRVNLGVSITSGNTETEKSRLDGELIARTQKRRYTLASTLNYATDNDVETESNIEGLFKLDHFITDKWYATGNLNLLKDKYKDLNLRTKLGAGAGYQFWESRLLNLSAEAGIDYIKEDFISSEDEEYPAARWALNYDQYLFDERVQIFHNHIVNVGLEDTKDILISAQTGLRIPIVSNLNANFQIDIDWDNSPGTDKKNTDSTYLLGLGYTF
ncbi:MAG: DUF481 domain-containing protein [Desulfobulbaceae bacterium]|nr:DUF481 domain-containing protein [Desulfobulbaceae bacterium]